ncbi:TonB-dependent receptor [Bacteroides sp. 224]|uniref:TonB-dependent receptor n=1 Tax=Bacteroides sp. 224 TaxID=2302936 RepID=UPI0013D3E1E8|nr:TonB-dependent receptor [Bacteroides sp. 224]NDV65869.1 SusC/RagA family TonB-linked outer membrane protein [Bacteroides sp. 224]
MENNQSCRRPNLFRTLLIFLFILVPFHLSMAQLTLSTPRANLGTVIKQIQNQSKYQFFYSDKLSAITVEPIKMKDASLEVVLNTLLKGKNISYKVEDNIVYLSEGKANESTKLINQERNVSGTVKDSQGEPIIGASVQVKGTEKGTITNLNGEYKLAVSGTGQVLVFSYIGYKKQEITIGAQSVINVTLKDDTQLIDEVVVTALGIKRAEKALSYNVQQVKTDDITTNKDVNFVNSLSGKVAGVNINTSSSGVGGVSKVVMRGTKSIMQTSNALYVIDGIPIFFGRNSAGSTEFNSQGASEPIADINPEDIESMTVLTGAAAAALYGSEAANGAIIITTKKGQEGKLSLTVTSNTEFTSPFIMPQFQNRYGTGSEGVLSPTGALSWGSRLTSANNYNYNPKDDYFQTGVIATETVSLATGTEKNQTYASAAVVNSVGITPNNKYNRYNFTVRNTTSFLKDKMMLDMSASYIVQDDRNMTNQGSYNNPLVGAYLFPRGNDWEDIRMYERYDPARKINTQYWPVGDEGMAMQNPYWINHRNMRVNKKDRYMLGTSLSYQILDWLSASGRVRVDNSNNDYTEKFYASSNTQVTEYSERGLYGITKTQDKQLYADFLVNINKNFGEFWSLQANIGTSYSDVRMDALKVRGPIADGSKNFGDDEPVGLTNFFAVQNLSTSKTKPIQDGWREQTQSIFASAELGYKNTYYLTVTGRNDWASQLAGPNSANSSFFYPSFGGSVILSELMPELNKDLLSFMKVRGSWASVGSPFARHLANPRYEWNESTKQWSITTQYPLYNLKPERTNSWEIGLSLRFLKDFNLDVTYYNAKTKNQTFDPQLAVSGNSSMYVQTGAVRNSGVELSLGYKNTWKGFTWDSGFTFSTNKNKILKLANNAVNPVTGETFSLNTLNVGGLGETRFLLKEGGTMGDIYSFIDLKRDDQGNILVDANGQPSTQTIQNADNYIKLGSVLPKANLAWRNNFSWNNFNAGFLISARLGGVVFSRTQAMLDYYGVSEASANAREQGYISINGNDQINPQTWYSVIGSGTSVPQYYTYSATNVRLQEVSFGYTFPRKMLYNICDVKLSLIGRNLWMIYNKAPFDPENIASTDNFYQGIDYFMMPALRNIGFSLSVKF